MLQTVNNNPTAPMIPELAKLIQPLEGENEGEVLDFLSGQPLLTFVMMGWIKDNGLVSRFNRGTFHGSRNHRGELDGVALIGHTVLFETNSESALSAFADLTRACPSAFVMMGQQQRISRFMDYYASESERPQKAFQEMLFEKRSKEHLEEPVGCLRRATSEEVDLVVPVHAEMTLQETGVNPLEADPIGFRERCARRIQQGRVWVCIEDQKLLFKADLISDLPDVNYLEGIYVRPENCGQGFGTRCMKQLTNLLLNHTKSVCLLTKDENPAAVGCYTKAGFKIRERYETLFLNHNSSDIAN